ncbi:MAG: chemotaxis protein CheA [Candidatus Sericytochromatia bacterium]|nr:chemotaxis protein CheA [Candidatus Sericytochromatia bacterium]
MDEVLAAFLAECRENLEKLDNELVLLERDPQGPHIAEALGKIFRTVHTIKGSCGWLGLNRLESVVHDGEDLLVCLREEKVAITTAIVTTLLEMFDAIREILAHISTTGSDESSKDYSSLVQALKALQSPVSLAAHQPAEPKTISAEPISAAPTVQRQQTAAESIRIDVKLLDKLMNLVGELVLTRNQMLQFTNTQEDAAFTITTQRLNLITSELQEGVMKTRMQMIGLIWNAYPRLVRDLALECGKQVSLEMDGKETELDRTMIDAIKDPLTHIVRNAIDHGLERPEERIAKGKPPMGRLTLRAYHEGGHVNISIQDDGAGIDPEKLRERALQKGLIQASDAAQMSDRALLNLIFLPGFSTAEKVTNISGRGVGMDVVKNNIEAVGGMVELISEKGKGSTFKIKIPLTLAIIPALMVISQNERFAIPQMNLLELVCLEGDDAVRSIEMIYNSPVYRLREKLLPLVYLNQVFEQGLSFADLLTHLKQQGEDARLNIVVLQADDQNFGLIVDQIHDTAEIVVKPLSKQLKNLSVYAGATILGDGKVALIIDVMGLAQRVNVISEAQRNNLQAELENRQDQDNELHNLLLFQAIGQRKMVIPLAYVARLEEFNSNKIEYAGDLSVVQYRKQILPLIHLAEVLPDSNRFSAQTEPDLEELLQVIVCVDQGRMAGIVVEKILDIVDSDDETEIQHSLKREGVIGSVILQGSVIDVLDFRGIIGRHIPSFFEDLPASQDLIAVR